MDNNENIKALDKDKPELLEKIVYAVIGLVAGAFGGYGVGRRKGNLDD